MLWRIRRRWNEEKKKRRAKSHRKLLWSDGAACLLRFIHKCSIYAFRTRTGTPCATLNGTKECSSDCKPTNNSNNRINLTCVVSAYVCCVSIPICNFTTSCETHTRTHGTRLCTVCCADTIECKITRNIFSPEKHIQIQTEYAVTRSLCVWRDMANERWKKTLNAKCRRNLCECVDCDDNECRG